MMRKLLLSLIGRAMGVSFHIDGFPYGANPKRGSGHSASR